MKAKYIGKSFGIDGLTNEKVYDVLEVDADSGALRVIDDSGEDYLYSPVNPKPAAVPDHPGGKWEIVEDNEAHDLASAVS